MTDKKFLQGILTAFCLAAIAACKPSEPPKPESSAETAEVEAKIQKFKATPTKATMEGHSGPNKYERESRLEAASLG
jgi:hypothetical protein